MGSSKIMANSLDDSVFDGVAREESVQEILEKVNSSQDGLAMTFVGGNLFGTTNNVSDIELLNVQGKGSMNYFYIRTKCSWANNSPITADRYAEIKVVCDGNVVARAKFIGGSTAYSRGYGANFILLTDQKYTKYMGGSGSQTQMCSPLGFNNLGYTTGYAHFRPAVPECHTLPMVHFDSSGEARDSVIFVSHAGSPTKIEFNSSLVIYYSHSYPDTLTSGDISGEFGYKLEE